MLAMLRKDLYVMWKYTAIFIAAWMAVVWASIRFLDRDAVSLYGMLPVFSLTFALNNVNADESCRWDRFAAMSPLRPRQIVLAKYVFALGVLAITTALAALAGGGRALWTAAALTLPALAMSLPLTYRLGKRKGSAVFLFFWGLAAAAILGTAHFRYDFIESAFGWMEDVPVPLLAAGAGAALLALGAGSVVLSVHFYTRRMRGWYD